MCAWMLISTHLLSTKFRFDSSPEMFAMMIQQTFCSDCLRCGWRPSRPSICICEMQWCYSCMYFAGGNFWIALGSKILLRQRLQCVVSDARLGWLYSIAFCRHSRSPSRKYPCSLSIITAVFLGDVALNWRSYPILNKRRFPRLKILLPCYIIPWGLNQLWLSQVCVCIYHH